MGNQLIWQDRFNIGVEVIDKEHRKLFNIINRLFTFSEQESKRRWVCEEGIKYFKDHAMKHFAEEEVYMASIHYPGFETHRRLHDNFRLKTLPELEKELAQTDFSPDAINHFLGVCTGWLIGHTLTEDHAIVGNVVCQWIDLLPEEQLTAMRQTILDLLYELFRLDARIISDRYSGEKFGKGIYYRLAYETSKGEKWQSILAFEENLILGTMGKLLGSSSKKIDVMLMNATRYTARQFVDCIREHFPAADEYEFKHENLLSYEQFQRLFEKENPQCSLLFNTGEGYFAYSTFAPHLLQNEPQTSAKPENTVVEIKTENAVEEIKNYLKNNKKSSDKKILLVDDSDVVLYAMTKLFEKDYQIATAKSGLSAIRCITLDRPDLILLDYEMPVCDGSQVLEMIRSEEDFADIPVIFLTGRVDKESVSKVMAFKPTGYLLKTLDPNEIKAKIDEYFKKSKR